MWKTRTPMPFSKRTLGIIATLALTALAAVSYRAAGSINVAAFGDTIAELRDTRRLAAEWVHAAGQGATVAPAEEAALDWRLLRPFGARWQERKGALERTAQGLDVPSRLANELAVYINALDARAEGVRHFGYGDHAPARAAAAWLERTTTDNLAARADALIGDFNALADTKHARVAWYKGGALVAVVALVAAWMPVLTARSRPAALGFANTRRSGPDASRWRAEEARRLREAMTAQLVAERLQAAAWRINATAVALNRAPSTGRLAARVDDEACDLADFAASFAELSPRGAPQPAVVDIAACLDEVVAGTDLGDVPVSWCGAPDQARMEVLAVPTAIRLMLANLLDNAARAVRLAHERATEGRVVISCALDSNRVVVTVMDNGIGMAAPQRERAFLPFCPGWPSEANGASGPVGMGCGLAIAARLVDACGGTIALGSALDGGTVAQIRLPLAASTSSTPPLAHTAPAV